MQRRALKWLAVAIVIAPTLAAADDINPPPWRGLPGTTFQHWAFVTPSQEPEHWNNPYGTPWASTDPSSWHPTMLGRDGVYEIGGGHELSFYIPNTPITTNRKLIWLQLTWFVGPGTSVVFTPFGSYDNAQLVGQTTFSDGWNHSTFQFDLDKNPPWERLVIRNDMPASILLDQVVVDTWCYPVPEPFTMGLGSAALGLAILRRRRKRA